MSDHDNSILVAQRDRLATLLRDIILASGVRLPDDISDDLPPGPDLIALGEDVARSLRASASALPAPTPEIVWVHLLEALAGDNGCSFSASTDDYREAKPALVELIAAGFFRDTADSLDGDIWTVAAGEQGEAAARFAKCADAYAVLSGVLNRVFDRPEEAPSLSAAGSAVEEVEVVGIVTASGMRRGVNSVVSCPALHRLRPGDGLVAASQHNRIVVALSAQQSDPWEPSGADYDRAIHRNPDAKAWADFFVSTFPGLTDKHELMIGWFANAMMAMHDHLKAQQSAPERVSVPFRVANAIANGFVQEQGHAINELREMLAARGDL